MKNLSYNEAIAEIQEILQEVEIGEIELDQLSIKLKRASELLTFCKNKLKKTDEDIEKLLKEIVD
jgi:exodeoxyribonuclease VII small subunit